jgi:hypothetical protein
MKNNILPRRFAVASLFVACACASSCGDDTEYDENGQEVQYTDVRIVGLDLGRGVDALGNITDKTDTFAPGDTVYAVVRTTGSSPLTTLAIRWKNSSGDQLDGKNIIIRPSRDTSYLFTLNHPAALGPGQYSLDLRVNWFVRKEAGFAVSTSAPARSVAEVPRLSPLVVAQNGIEKKYDGVAAAEEDSLDPGASADQSPFEWRGIRAGMSWTKLDRISRPASQWACTPFMLSGVAVQRDIAIVHETFSAGHISGFVDTVGRRVLDVRYSQTWLKPGDARRVAFEREMTGLAAKWDALPGVIRHPATPEQGPYFAAWETRDSVWSARMYYYMDAPPSGHPNGFEIEEIRWGDRLEKEVTDSIKGLMRNPASEYYQTPNTACTALVPSR